MESKHTDLLNQILSEEQTTTEIPEEKEEVNKNTDSIDEKINEGCIPIKSCTGTMFFIDPNDPQNADLFAPENLLKNIAGFSEQEDSLIKVMHTYVTNINNVSKDEIEEYSKHLNDQLLNALKGYGISEELYTKLNSNLTEYDKAIYMLFDLFSFTKTINHFLVSMSMADMVMGNSHNVRFTNNNVFEDGEVDIPTPKKENKGYKVYATVTDSGKVDIIQIEEDYGDPSDMYIVHEDDAEGVYYMYTIAESEEDACASAKIVFAGFVRDMNETEAEKAIRIADEMNTSSGLVE